ncbi:MAG: YkgJ family cysteine cluster protein [Myxococcota bacterium]
MTHPLAEYFAALERIEEAANVIFARRRADIACRKGCASCCVDGLTVLSVEAAAIAMHLEETGFANAPAPSPGGCAFLDAAGACTIYEARPVLCRTHGVPIRMSTSDDPERSRTSLRVLDNVSVCELNFRERDAVPEDILDGERLAALLLVVEQRFRIQQGLPGPAERIPLRALLIHAGTA